MGQLLMFLILVCAGAAPVATNLAYKIFNVHAKSYLSALSSPAYAGCNINHGVGNAVGSQNLSQPTTGAILWGFGNVNQDETCIQYGVNFRAINLGEPLSFLDTCTTVSCGSSLNSAYGVILHDNSEGQIPGTLTTYWSFENDINKTGCVDTADTFYLKNHYTASPSYLEICNATTPGLAQSFRNLTDLLTEAERASRPFNRWQVIQGELPTPVRIAGGSPLVYGTKYPLYNFAPPITSLLATTTPYQCFYAPLPGKLVQTQGLGQNLTNFSQWIFQQVTPANVSCIRYGDVVAIFNPATGWYLETCGIDTPCTNGGQIAVQLYDRAGRIPGQSTAQWRLVGGVNGTCIGENDQFYIRNQYIITHQYLETCGNGSTGGSGVETHQTNTRTEFGAIWGVNYTQPSLCSPHAHEVGGENDNERRCECKTGYHGDGRHCEPRCRCGRSSTCRVDSKISFGLIDLIRRIVTAVIGPNAIDPDTCAKPTGNCTFTSPEHRTFTVPVVHGKCTATFDTIPGIVTVIYTGNGRYHASSASHSR